MNHVRTHRDVVVRLIRVKDRLFRLDVGPFGEDDVGNPWTALIFESCQGWCHRHTAKCQHLSPSKCNKETLLTSWTKAIEDGQL